MHANLPQAFLDWLTVRESQTCHRQLLVISGDQEWALDIANGITQTLNSGSLLWCGGNTRGDTISSNEYRQYLGQEFNTVVFNAFSGVRANAMMALSGSVKSDGLMILICPKLSVWPTLEDPQQIKRTSYGHLVKSNRSSFLDWLVSHIETDLSVAVLTPEHFKGRVARLDPLVTLSDRFVQQQQAVESIVKVANGHNNKPLVITADRGRGKSSALGIAAAHLIQHENKNILLSAPNRNAVQKVFEHATKELKVAATNANEVKAGQHWLRFFAMDNLLDNLPEADLVIIDEAAAIPNDQLKKLNCHYKHVVYSSTVHGYEGSGRGFEIRFKDHLHCQSPGWKNLHLDIPLRWFEHDPLEKFWFNVMLMNGETRTPAETENTDSSTDWQKLDTHQLTSQPESLSQLFNLLIDAHYQTVPDDLVRLLDAPEQHVFVARKQNRIVAALIASEEGGEKLNDVALQISQGKRRVPGHLLPQSLAYHIGDKTYATLRYLRIVRIAVENNHRRRGIASELMTKTADFAISNGFDILGTSFGLIHSTMQFWEKNRFSPAKLGTRKDASSGEYSLIMLRALNPSKNQYVVQLTQLLDREVQYRENRQSLHFCSQLLSSLTEKKYRNAKIDTDYIFRLLTQFAGGSRPLDSCTFAIHEYLTSGIDAVDKLSFEAKFLDDLVVKNIDYKQICLHYSLTGKKEITQHARQCVKKLIC